MTLKAKLATSTPSFAHLVGRAPAAAAEDDPPRKEGESDEDYAKRAKAAEDEDKKKDGESDEEHKARVASNRARRAAEDEKPDENAAGNDDDRGDDDSDGGDMRREGIGQARLRERARCAAIFGDPAAGRNQELAATLAFTTNTPRSEAIRILRSAGTPAPATPAAAPRRTLDSRMAALPPMPVIAGGAAAPASGGAPKDQAYQTATLMLVANMKRLGEGPEAIAKFIAERNAA
ncbi:MAG TPA: hypothetical protein VK741_25540 [Acetobacteraceae bacterium]|jgi:hypothetical protein|nr:hypothetical protein [Acetobacteraceae bacterium]